MFLANFLAICTLKSRSQGPRGLRRRSTAAGLLRSWVRIPLGAWMFVCFECCVLSDRGLCDGLITRPGESYRLWRVVVCDQEISYARRLQPRQRAAKYKPTMGCSASRGKNTLKRSGNGKLVMNFVRFVLLRGELMVVTVETFGI